MFYQGDTRTCDLSFDEVGGGSYAKVVRVTREAKSIKVSQRDGGERERWRLLLQQLGFAVVFVYLVEEEGSLRRVANVTL